MPVSRGKAIGQRMAFTLLAGIYGWACLGSGLDRLSAMNPTLQGGVPAPFRANAETAKAALAWGSGKGVEARDAARRAVLADPMDRRPVALLGTQHLLAQDYAGAEAAFRIGAQLGWREPVTQSYWYRAALQSGDATRAAERVDALLRANPAMRGGDELLDPLLAAPKGRQALAQRLSYRPGWLPLFLSAPRTASEQALAARADVIAQMAGHGIRLKCEEIQPLEQRLTDAGLQATANALRSGHCDMGQTRGLLSDPEFADLARGAPGGHAGWQLHSSGDVSVSAGGFGPDAGVMVSNLASVRRPILSQRVDLEPGAYRVKLVTEPGASTGLIGASLSCAGKRRYPDLGQPLVIAAGACPSEMLMLWLSPAKQEIRIASVRLERVE